MKQYKYHLASPEEQRKHNGKWCCPQCDKRTFVPYLDANNNIVDERKYGRCERINSCGYILYPDNKESIARRKHIPIHKPKPKATFLNAEQRERYFKPTLTRYDVNHLIMFLRGVFDTNSINKMIEEYYIGTHDHFSGGAAVFWQIDRFGYIHRGKVMQYDQNTGKRKKINGKGLVTYIHSLNDLGDLPVQCLFGEHLLSKYPNMFVGIVESEKTAIIASGVFKDCIMLATGGCSNFTPAMCQALRGRNVVLFPDNGKFDEWGQKGRKMRYLFKTLSIVDMMENPETLQRWSLNDGDDIGDLILACNLDPKYIQIELKEL